MIVDVELYAGPADGMRFGLPGPLTAWMTISVPLDPDDDVPDPRDAEIERGRYVIAPCSMARHSIVRYVWEAA